LISVGGDVDIQDNALTYVRGLQQLATVLGRVLVRRMPSVTRASFPSLKDVGTDPVGDYLIFQSLPNLQRVDSFPALETVADAFEVDDCAAIETIGNFPSLTRVGDFQILNNPNLLRVGSAPNLTQVTDDVEIRNNPQLEGFDSLPALQTVVDTVIFDRLTAATTIALPALQSIGGSLEVNQCEGITSLSGLSNVDAVGTHFDVRLNTSLATMGMDDLQSVAADGDCATSGCGFIVLGNSPITDAEVNAFFADIAVSDQANTNISGNGP
jgi:hypothetical protein